MKRILCVLILALTVIGCSKKNTIATVMPEKKPVVAVFPEKQPEIEQAQTEYAEQVKQYKMVTVLFDFGKSDLRTEDALVLDELAADDYVQGRVIRIVGHTCPIGSDDYNMGLGYSRAAEVKKYLMSRGLAGGLIETTSWGENEPIETSPDLYWRNRRAEITVE